MLLCNSDLQFHFECTFLVWLSGIRHTWFQHVADTGLEYLTNDFFLSQWTINRKYLFRWAYFDELRKLNLWFWMEMRWRSEKIIIIIIMLELKKLIKTLENSSKSNDMPMMDASVQRGAKKSNCYYGSIAFQNTLTKLLSLIIIWFIDIYCVQRARDPCHHDTFSSFDSKTKVSVSSLYEALQ